MHDAFVAFDNSPSIERPEDRLSFVLTVRKLPMRENKIVCDLVEAMHGEGALGRRGGKLVVSGDKSQPQLEYLKYFIVRRGSSIMHIVDMDTTFFVKPPPDIVLKRALTESKMIVDEDAALSCDDFFTATRLEEFSSLRFCSPMHEGHMPKTQIQLQYNTATHGRIRIKLSKYADPDVRNGIEISVQRNLNVKTCWGTLVKATAPKNVRLKHLMKDVPSKTAEEAEEINSSTYYKITDCTGFYNGVKREVKMLKPANSKK